MLPFRPYPGALGTATVFFAGTISRHLGQLAVVAGDNTSAVELLREALDRNRTIGARPDTALASLLLARVLRKAGSPNLTEAARLAQDALEIAARLDMPGTVAEAGRLVADIAAERDGADPFTAREGQPSGPAPELGEAGELVLGGTRRELVGQAKGSEGSGHCGKASPTYAPGTPAKPAPSRPLIGAHSPAILGRVPRVP